MNLSDGTKIMKEFSKNFDKLRRAADKAAFTYKKFHDALFPKEAKKERHRKRYLRMMERGRQKPK